MSFLVRFARLGRAGDESEKENNAAHNHAKNGEAAKYCGDVFGQELIFNHGKDARNRRARVWFQKARPQNTLARPKTSNPRKQSQRLLRLQKLRGTDKHWRRKI